MRVSVVGLGKLGLPLAAVLAKYGHHVVGVDLDKEKVRAVNSREVISPEPHLAEYVREADHLEATDSYDYAVEHSDITLIMVNTESKGPEGYGTEQLGRALESLRTALEGKGERHVVVVVSTVLPGTMRGFVAPFFEDLNVDLLYSPIFPAIGSVIENLEYPDFVVVGGEVHEAMHDMAMLFWSAYEAGLVRYMSWENAELVKMADNAFCCMKISFANTLSEICERVRGGDIDVVTETIGLDPRIGSKLLKGGLGYGGPCYPKDDRAFIHTAKRLMVAPWLLKAAQRINKYQIYRVLNRSVKGKKVSVLGVTYKPGVGLEEGLLDSQAQEIVEHLGAKWYDPSGGPYTLEEVLGDAEVVIIATPWPEFKELRPEAFPEGCTVIDCWRILDRESFKKRVKYVGLGLGGV